MTSKNQYFFNLPELSTPRLLLRKIYLSDAEDIFEYASKEEITKYLSWNHHQTIEDSKQFIYMVTQNYMDGDPSSWAIYHKEDQKMIGTIGFVSYNSVHKRGEVGYALSKKYWRQGITSEALQAVLEFGFSMLNLSRIEARCYPENTASEKLLLKNNFQFEGTLRKHIIINDTPIDMKMFSMLDTEYIKRPE